MTPDLNWKLAPDDEEFEEAVEYDWLEPDDDPTDAENEEMAAKALDLYEADHETSR